MFFDFPDPSISSKYEHAQIGFIPLSESELKLDTEFKNILRNVYHNRTQVLNTSKK